MNTMRGVLGSEVIKSIQTCGIDPALIIVREGGNKFIITTDEPCFEDIFKRLWKIGVKLD